MARSPEEIAQIAQSCLDDIQSGQGTIASVLAGYPDLEDVLRPQLETAIWLNKSSQLFDPRPGFVSASRGRLVTQIKQGSAVTTPPLRQSVWDVLNGFFQKKLTLQFAVTLLLVLSLFLGTNRAAFAARSTLPGDLLYPVKITHENVQLLISITPESDVRLHTTFAQRRLVEIQEIILEGRYEYIHDTVEAYEKQVTKAVETLKKVAARNMETAEVLATSLYSAIDGQTLLLAVMSETLPKGAKDEVARVAQISESGVQAMRALNLVVAAVYTKTPFPGSEGTSLPLADELATSTPAQELVHTPTSSQTATPTETSAPTATASPTRTSRPTDTLLPGDDPVLLPSPTATGTTPINTPTQATIVEDTPTPPPTLTQTPSPTSTPTDQDGPPPTQETTATFTPQPTATSTPLPPPTSTPPPPLCRITAGIAEPLGVDVGMFVANSGQAAIVLTSLTIDWPQTYPNPQVLETIWMGGGTIWDESDDQSPTEVTAFKGDENFRRVGASSVKAIGFRFKRSVTGTVGYTVTLEFDNGCSVTATR